MQDSKKSRSSNNFTVILLIVISFFAGYFYFKTKSLEQKNLQAGSVNGANVQNQPQDSPLSVENLKKYAKELSLNTNKFNNCLDKGDKKKEVADEQNQGAGLGVQGTPGFFVNGKFLGGAFPFEAFKDIIDKEIAGKGSTNAKDYSEMLQQASTGQPKAFDPVPKKIDLTGLTPEGAKNAKVTIVEFSDFQCPYCIRAYSTVKKVLETYPNDVQIYYKQFPLTQIHPFAQKAAEASLCAKDQDKFWKYERKLFEVQGG